MPASIIDPELRARLDATRLRVLARGLTGVEVTDERPMGALAAVVVGDDGFVLASGSAGIGAAVAWAHRQRITGALHVFVDPVSEGGPDAAVLARRAQCFRVRPLVYRIEGTAAVPARPGPHLAVLAPDPAALAAIEPLLAAGADLVVEHGVVMAELSGLEVGRVVVDDSGEGMHLEIGVGHHDRAATQIMEAVLSAQGTTANVVDVVRAHRRAGRPPHLLTRIARQRWLRSCVVADPAVVGARHLELLEPPLPRRNLVEPIPALAAGEDLEGRPLVVACAVGVELEAIPTAADGRDRFDPAAELVFAAPARDHYPVVVGLAAALVRPARLVALAGDWTD